MNAPAPIPWPKTLREYTPPKLADVLDSARSPAPPVVLPAPYKPPVRDPSIYRRQNSESAMDALVRIGPLLWLELEQATAPDGALIERIGTLIPCGQCREHWKAMVARTPPDFGDGWLKWVWERHNEVNALLGRDLFPWDQFLLKLERRQQ